MENQNEIRNKVKRRCMMQTQIAKEIGMTNIYFNSWLKGHREIGKDGIAKINKWLNEQS